jgi:hypothetical protein
MYDRVGVTIDLPLLIADLSREEGRAVSVGETIKWLSRAGFAQYGNLWLVREADLGHLNPAEVLKVWPVSFHS